MASSRTIKAGEAYVRLFADNSPLIRGLKQAEAQLNQFGTAVTRIGRRVAGLGAALAAPFVPAVAAASDAAESLSRFEQVFGDHVDAASAFADELAERVGRSGTQIRDAMSSFQSFFIGMGLGADRARELAQQMTELAIDFGSFNNLSDDDAIGRFISGLSGSSEVFDRFGINIKAAALEQELLNEGLASSAASASEAAKALARIGIITKTMTDQGAVGDATRTAGSFSNRLKALAGSARDFAEAVGAPLLEPLAAVAGKVVEMARAATAWVKENEGVVVAVAATAAGVTALGGSLLAIGAAVTLAGAALGGLATVLGLVFNPLTLAVGGVAAGTAALVAFTDAGKAAADTVGSAFERVAASAREMGAAIYAAVSAGDLEAAFEVLRAAGSLAFAHLAGQAQVGFAKVEATAAAAWDAFKRGAVDAVFGALTALEELRAGVALILGAASGLNESELTDILARQLEEAVADLGRRRGRAYDAAGVRAHNDRSLELYVGAVQRLADERIAGAADRLAVAMERAREAAEARAEQDEQLARRNPFAKMPSLSGLSGGLNDLFARFDAARGTFNPAAIAAVVGQGGRGLERDVERGTRRALEPTDRKIDQARLEFAAAMTWE